MDYYAVLQIARDAEDEVIAFAYKALARKYHPDRNPGNAECHTKMTLLNEAYGVLRDPEKRAEYDLSMMRTKSRIGEQASRQQDAARQREQDAARQREQDAARQREHDAARQREQDAARQREHDAARQREQDATRQREQEVTRQREQDATRQRGQEVTPLSHGILRSVRICLGACLILVGWIPLSLGFFHYMQHSNADDAACLSIICIGFFMLPVDVRQNLTDGFKKK